MLNSAKEAWARIFLRRKYIHRDYAYVFGTPEGKRVLAHICEMGYLNKSTFNPNIPEKTILNEGSRLLVLAILKHTHVEPTEGITQAITEGDTYQ